MFDCDLSPEESYEAQVELSKNPEMVERGRKRFAKMMQLRELEEESMKVNSLHHGTKE